MDYIRQISWLIFLLTGTCFGTFGDRELEVDGAKLIWNNNSQTFSISASGSMSESVDYVWPPADGSPGQAIITNGSGILSFTAPSTSFTHDILSITHADTNVNAVTRGSIIYGNSMPKWDELTISSTIGSALTKILGTDGTDSGFRTIANFALDIDGILDHGNLESSSLDDADHNASYYTETEIGSVNSSTSGSTLMGMATISGSTFSTLQHMQNLFHSTGWVSGGVVSDNGNDTVAVTAGTGVIKASAGTTQQILFFDWSLNNSLSVPVNTTRYVGVEYNVGSPQLVVRTTNNFDNDTDFILASLINESSTIHIQKEEHAVGDHANNMIQRLFDTMPFTRDNRSGGLILGESGDNNRNLTMTAGTVWEKLNEFSISAVDTSVGGGDTFDRYLTDGAGGHTKQSAQTTWDNTQFDSSGTLTTLGNNKYAVQWYYIELDDDFVSVYGTAQYNTEAEAETEAPPTDIPDRISLHSKLIGRIVFQESDTVPQSIESVFTQTFTAAGITDHGNLAGLGDDDHTQYLLADGTRALAGAWDMNSQNLTNVNIDSGTVDGITSLTVANSVDIGNFTLTANGLTIDGTFTDGTMSIASGALSGVTTVGCGAITSTGILNVSLAGNAAIFQNTTDAISNQVAQFKAGNRAAAANDDEGYLSFYADNEDEDQVEIAQFRWTIADNSAGDEGGEFAISVADADSSGAITEIVRATMGGAVFPQGIAGSTVGIEDDTTGKFLRLRALANQYSADRILSIDLDDVARTLTIQGDAIIGGHETSTGASPTFTGTNFTGIPSAGVTNNVSATANITDHAIVRGHGGAKVVQTTGIIVDDSDNISGIGTHASTGRSSIAQAEDYNAAFEIDATGAFTVNGFADPADYFNIGLDSTGRVGIRSSGAIYFNPNGGGAVGFFGSGQFGFLSDNTFRFGSSGAALAKMEWDTAQTVDSFLLGLDDNATFTGRYMVICDEGDINFNFQHTVQANPTVFIHSANQATDEWLSLTHDQTDGVISVGTGALKMPATLKIGNTTLTEQNVIDLLDLL